MMLHARRSVPPSPALAVLLLVAAVAGAAPLAAQVLEHEFTPLDGHDGRARLGELYGHPVVVAGFEQHLGKGMNAAWVAKDLLAEHADDGLIVVLEDQTAWTSERLRARIRAFWMKFFPSRPWITSNLGAADPDLPIERKASRRDEKSLVLIGVDGRLVLEGTAEDPATGERPDDYRVAFARAVEDELERRKKGWGEHATERKVRAAAFGKEDLAAAWRTLERAPEPEPGEDREALGAELDRAFAARRKVVRHRIDEGDFAAADDALDRLRKSVRGLPRYEAELEDLVAELGSPEAAAARKLEKRLDKLLKLVHARKFAQFGPEGIAAVRQFASENEESPVGARATAMDALLVHLVAFTKGIGLEEVERRVADELGR